MGELMRDPVCNSVGNSYEREALLQAWARQPGRERDPLTNELVPSTLLFPNQALRRQIMAWLEEHSQYPKGGKPGSFLPCSRSRTRGSATTTTMTAMRTAATRRRAARKTVTRSRHLYHWH